MDSQVISQVAGQIVMMALMGIAGWLGGKIKGAQAEHEKNKQEDVKERDQNRSVQRVLLYYRMQDLFRKYVAEGEPITSAEKHQIEELYELYKGLGGNGEGQRMYKELIALKTN